jgi:hypothetical protein
LKLARIVALQVALKCNAKRLQTLIGTDDDNGRIRKALTAYMASDRIGISTSAVRAAAFLLLASDNSEQINRPLLTSTVRAINHQFNDVKRLVGIVMRHLALSSLLITSDFTLLKVSC